MKKKAKSKMAAEQDYAGSTGFKSLKCQQSYNKTDMEVNWGICTRWPGPNVTRPTDMCHLTQTNLCIYPSMLP